ncbi:MAG: hypothetical protein ACI4F3_12170 [Enterocloster sp.]
MPLPPGITRKLLQATSDKTALDRKALHLSHSFQEVSKLLESSLKPPGKK